MSKEKRRRYQDKLEEMQVELNAMARWLQHTGKRLVVLFEGRDTAGKGGAIGAITEHLNPRQCRVVALPKPSELEAGQWYFPFRKSIGTDAKVLFAQPFLVFGVLRRYDRLPSALAL